MAKYVHTCIYIYVNTCVRIYIYVNLTINFIEPK